MENLQMKKKNANSASGTQVDTCAVSISGEPIVVDTCSINSYPAIVEEYGRQHRDFGGYRIPLSRFKDVFCGIKFRGKGNADDVVCGYIVDDNGYVESVASVPDDADGYSVLPLTEKSHALYASVPLKDGKPIWDIVTIELFVFAREHSLALC